MTSRFSELSPKVEEDGPGLFLLGWERWLDWQAVPKPLWPRDLREAQLGADLREEILTCP